MEQTDPRDRAAGLWEGIAGELELAPAHARTVASHYRAREIPRAPAHRFSVVGHLAATSRLLDEAAELHARMSQP